MKLSDRAYHELKERVYAKDLSHVMREHLPVLEACRRRDPAAAADAMDDHLNSALRRAMGI